MKRTGGEHTNNRLYSAEGTHRYKSGNRRLKATATHANMGLPEIRGASGLIAEDGPGLMSP